MDPARYDAWYDSPLGQACFDAEVALLRRGAGGLAGRTVLEVGCGTGRFLTALARHAPRAVGVDGDRAMVLFARRHAGVPGAGHYAWVTGEAAALPLASASFDVVLANTLLCFCPDPRPVVREMVRVCRPGGRVLVGELNPYSPWRWWRSLRAALGLGSFRGARWHRPRHIVAAVAAEGCEVRWIGRAIFWPPANVPGILRWRAVIERIGAVFWAWAGAYYVVSGTKRHRLTPRANPFARTGARGCAPAVRSAGRSPSARSAAAAEDT